MQLKECLALITPPLGDSRFCTVDFCLTNMNSPTFSSIKREHDFSSLAHTLCHSWSTAISNKHYQRICAMASWSLPAPANAITVPINLEASFNLFSQSFSRHWMRATTSAHWPMWDVTWSEVSRNIHSSQFGFHQGIIFTLLFHKCHRFQLITAKVEVQFLRLKSSQ